MSNSLYAAHLDFLVEFSFPCCEFNVVWSCQLGEDDFVVVVQDIIAVPRNLGHRSLMLLLGSLLFSP